MGTFTQLMQWELNFIGCVDDASIGNDNWLIWCPVSVDPGEVFKKVCDVSESNIAVWIASLIIAALDWRCSLGDFLHRSSWIHCHDALDNGHETCVRNLDIAINRAADATIDGEAGPMAAR